jgi:small-conductance mechanosensitive channel
MQGEEHVEKSGKAAEVALNIGDEPASNVQVAVSALLLDSYQKPSGEGYSLSSRRTTGDHFRASVPDKQRDATLFMLNTDTPLSPGKSAPIFAGDPDTEPQVRVKRPGCRGWKFWFWSLYGVCLIVSALTVVLGRTVWYDKETRFVFKITLFIFCGIISFSFINLLIGLVFWWLKRFYSIRKYFFFYVYVTPPYLIAFFWSLTLLVCWAVCMYPLFCCGGPHASATYSMLQFWGSLLGLTALMVIKQVLVNVFGLSFERGGFKKRAEDVIFAEHIISLLNRRLGKLHRTSPNSPPEKHPEDADLPPPPRLSAPLVHSDVFRRASGKGTTNAHEMDFDEEPTETFSSNPRGHRLSIAKRIDKEERSRHVDDSSLRERRKPAGSRSMDPTFFYGKSRFYSMFSEDEPSHEEIDHLEFHVMDEEHQEARRHASLIFYAIKSPDRSFLIEEDFTRLGGDMKYAFRLFKGKLDSNVTRASIEQTLFNLSQERRLITRNINNNRSIVSKLNVLLTLIFLVIAGILASFIFMGGDIQLFQAQFQTFLLSISTMLVAYTFLIGPLFRDLLNCVLFVFLMHPYDVGDRVIIDMMNLIVYRVNFISTEFIQWDGQRMYIPNTVLLGKVITNVRRSDPERESIILEMHVETSTDVLQTFEQRIRSFFEANKTEFDSNFALEFKQIEKSNKLCFNLAYQGYENSQAYLPRWHRRARLLLFIRDLLEEMQVVYVLPPQPVCLSLPNDASEKASSDKLSDLL